MARAGPRTVQRYSLEFKLTAVRLSQQPGIEVQAVAGALDIHPFMLYRVTRAGCYAWRRRPESARAKQDRALQWRITKLFASHHGRYGSPRIHRTLTQQGWALSLRRVERLMRAAGLRARVVRVYRSRHRTRSRHSTLRRWNVPSCSPLPTYSARRTSTWRTSGPRSAPKTTGWPSRLRRRPAAWWPPARSTPPGHFEGRA
jgi:hypothetical protein